MTFDMCIPENSKHSGTEIQSGARRCTNEQTIEYIQKTKPEEEWPEFDAAYKKEWEVKYPLGYVEHRLGWAATGEYGEWVISHNTVIKINDILFLHGGLSPQFAAMDTEEVNTRARTELVEPSLLGPEALINASEGPVWYRGWAELSETEENEALLDQVLASHGASRMVIAHTPLVPTVLPRFGGKVLLIDVGLAEHYGSGFACLVIEGNETYALQRGTRLDIPTERDAVIDYLTMAATLEPNPVRIENYIEKLLNPEPIEMETVPEDSPDTATQGGTNP